MNGSLVKIGKLGEGTYGSVYSARSSSRTPNESKVDDTIVAMKRNLMDTAASWIGNIRELDILSRLRHHPMLVSLLSVSFGSPFTGNPMTPINETLRGMKEDKIHFVLEYVEKEGTSFFPDKRQCTPVVGKILACQLLLAVEYIHAYNVTHRDLKPANILIKYDEEGQPLLKVCDFGMSQILCQACPSTPGVATSWYRAPEICCSVVNYGRESDLWSVGCILFEIFGRDPFLYRVTDTSNDAFNAILGKLPKSPDREVIRRFELEGERMRPKPEASPIRRRSFLDQMQMSDEYLAEFDQTPGTMAQFQEILTGMLEIDPNKRMSTTQALDHEFFDYFRDYINGVRKVYPPIYPTLPSIKIIQCAERRWAVNLAFSIYNHRDKIIWYKHRIIFHAIDLFDRYLEWAHASGHALASSLETAHTGRLLSRAESELRFYVCMYSLHKYYSTMSYPVDWTTFTPPAYSTPEAQLVAEQFEILLIKDITQFQMYRDTLLEITDHYGHHVTETFIRDLLLLYGTCDSWSTGSVRALYRKLMKMEEAPLNFQPLPLPSE